MTTPDSTTHLSPAEAHASYRARIEALLAGPGADLPDALAAFVLDEMQKQRRDAIQKGFHLGREEAERASSDALKRAHEQGTLDLSALATDLVAQVVHAPAPGEAEVAAMERALAEVMQLQRDTDRAIVAAEAERLDRIAEQHPGLASHAADLAKELTLTAQLIGVGLDPGGERLATMMAYRRAAASGELQERVAPRPVPTPETPKKGKPRRGPPGQTSIPTEREVGLSARGTLDDPKVAYVTPEGEYVYPLDQAEQFGRAMLAIVGEIRAFVAGRKAAR